jgi:hypothetical protein
MNKLLLMPMMLCLFLVACGKTEDVKTEEVTIVGLWKPATLGTVTDVKTLEITLTDIQTYNKPLADTINFLSFDLRADGTATVPSNDKVGKDVGKYVLSTDKKTLTYTSNTRKDSKGVIFVEVYEVITLTSTDLKLGFPKKVKVGTAFPTNIFSIDFALTLIFGDVYQKKNPVVDPVLATATTIQNTLGMKK